MTDKYDNNIMIYMFNCFQEFEYQKLLDQKVNESNSLRKEREVDL